MSMLCYNYFIVFLPNFTDHCIAVALFILQSFICVTYIFEKLRKREIFDRNFRLTDLHEYALLQLLHFFLPNFTDHCIAVALCMLQSFTCVTYIFEKLQKRETFDCNFHYLLLPK